MSMRVVAPSGVKNIIRGKGYHFAIATQKSKGFSQHFIQELLLYKNGPRF